MFSEVRSGRRISPPSHNRNAILLTLSLSYRHREGAGSPLSLPHAAGCLLFRVRYLIISSAPPRPSMPSIRLRTTAPIFRTLTSTARQTKSRYEIIPKCPPSTCACAPMPKLNIDRTRPIANTVPPYTEHIVIPTGQHDWPSRIEDSDRTTDWGQLTSYLKREFGPKGSAYDPENPVLISTSSFSPDPDISSTSKRHLPPSNPETSSLLLFPSFQHHQSLSLSPSSLRNLPTTIRSSLSEAPQPIISPNISSIRTPTILICSHNSRDTRCGTLGPILQAEFVTQLSRLGITANTGLFRAEGPDVVNVGCISHVGGHAWAGNVIIYLPVADNTAAGIWYGRVEPRHVDVIIRETVLGGRVIGELWRGGIGRDGAIVRI